MTEYEYVRELLGFYVTLPETPNRVGWRDRQLARHFFRSGIELEHLRHAMLYASGRRLRRPPEAYPPLRPIRSLNYFLPVLEELRVDEPLDEGYVLYLEKVVFPERFAIHINRTRAPKA